MSLVPQASRSPVVRLLPHFMPSFQVVRVRLELLSYNHFYDQLDLDSLQQTQHACL